MTTVDLAISQLPMFTQIHFRLRQPWWPTLPAPHAGRSAPLAAPTPGPGPLAVAPEAIEALPPHLQHPPPSTWLGLPSCWSCPPRACGPGSLGSSRRLKSRCARRSRRGSRTRRLRRPSGTGTIRRSSKMPPVSSWKRLRGRQLLRRGRLPVPPRRPLRPPIKAEESWSYITGCRTWARASAKRCSGCS